MIFFRAKAVLNHRTHSFLVKIGMVMNQVRSGVLNVNYPGLKAEA